MISKLTKVLAVVLAAALGAPALTQAADKKPNILVIWGDDIGRDNIGAGAAGDSRRVPSFADHLRDSRPAAAARAW